MTPEFENGIYLARETHLNIHFDTDQTFFVSVSYLYCYCYYYLTILVNLLKTI